MVGNYFCRVVILLCGMLLAQGVVAADMHITLEQDTVELGHPIWLTLTSDQTAVSLNTLDFSSWQDKVVLPRSYDVNLADDNRSQTLRLRLYPLQEGKLILPGLHFLNQTTPPVAIRVIAAQDTKLDTPIDFQHHISTHTPWQQQQVIVACTLTMQDAYAVLSQPKRDYGNGVQVSVMQVQRHRITQNGVSRTVYELGWILTPTRAGKLQLQLPPVQYARDGVVVRRFYVPSLTLAVQARPAWLPGTIPAGRVSVSHYGVSGPWLSTDVLNHVQLRLQLEGMAAEVIPAYALQLRSDRTLRFYAAQRQLHTMMDSTGMHHSLSYDIPVVARHIGIYHLPSIRLQYFDPDTGTLKTATIFGPSILVLNSWLKVIILLLIATVLFWILRTVLHFLLRHWRRYQTYQQAIAQLQQTDSLDTIKQAMQTMAQAEGWPRNLSFKQWQARMQSVTPLAQHLRVSKLNAAGYAQAELEIAPVVQTLMRIGKQRRFALH